jgi:uncharacterized membrane protein
MGRAPTAKYLRGFRWYRRSRLWVVPTAGAAVALALAAISLSVDHLVVTGGAPIPIFSGEPATARTILSLIATAIATLTALVLTIVAIIIQLATQSLSPRAVRTFLQDAHSHLTIGIFVTTFTYSLVVLQQFNLTYDLGEESVTSTSVTLAFVLAVVSLGMFISYVDHIVHGARVTSIIDRLGNETRREIERTHPREEDAPAEVVGEIPGRDADVVIASEGNGVVLEIDVDRLLRELEHCDALAVMVPAVGDFIPTGGRLFEVYGDARAADARLFRRAVQIDAERSIMQDAPFGFRLLIDIAERSLSSGVNDPTTATQVVDQLHDLLRQLGSRRLPNGWYADREGTARLFVSQPGWETYVALAFEEIRHHGGDSLQVVRRLRSAVEDLIDNLPEGRHPPLRRQIRLLDDAAESSFRSDAERMAARHADAQGIGSGGGLGPVDGQDGVLTEHPHHRGP